MSLSKIHNTSFNITYGNAITLQKAAEEIVKITGSKSKIIDTGRNALYPDRGTLDISRARELVDYDPKFNFAEGLVSTYRWIKQWPSTS